MNNSLLKTYSFESFSPITSNTITQEKNSNIDPNEIAIAGIQVSGAENFDMMVSPTTRKSAIKNGKGMIFDDSSVLVKF